MPGRRGFYPPRQQFSGTGGPFIQSGEDDVAAHAPVVTGILGLQAQVPGVGDRIDGDGQGQTGTPGGLVQLHRRPVNQSGRGVGGHRDGHPLVGGCGGAGGAVIGVVGPDALAQLLQIGGVVRLVMEEEEGKGIEDTGGFLLCGPGIRAVQRELPAPVEEGGKLLQVQGSVKAGAYGKCGARQIRCALQSGGVHIGAVGQCRCSPAPRGTEESRRPFSARRASAPWCPWAPCW